MSLRWVALKAATARVSMDPEKISTGYLQPLCECKAEHTSRRTSDSCGVEATADEESHACKLSCCSTALRSAVRGLVEVYIVYESVDIYTRMWLVSQFYGRKEGNGRLEGTDLRETF